MREGVSNISPARRRSAVRSGILTGLSFLALAGTSAAVAAILAQKFGHTAETDGFFAAFGVYLVLVLAAQSFRLVVLPDLTRAAEGGRLGAETRAYLASIAALGVVVSVLVVVLRHPLGDAITSSLPSRSAHIAASALTYLVPAAFGQLLAAVTAGSVALVSSAPLTRRGVDAESAAAHVVNASWLSLALIAAAAGVFALVGPRVVEAILGSSFSGRDGRQLGHLVVYLAPWTFATVAYTLAFPLVFVVGRHAVLVPVAVGAVALHVPLTWALRKAFGMPGIAVALALSTFVVLAVLLVSLSLRALRLAAAGLARLALVEAALAAASFGLLALVVGGIPAAVIGLAVYGALIVAWRPRGLREAWAYVRALH